MRSTSKQGKELSVKGYKRIEFGKKVNFLAKLLGCWHKNLSRPFTHGRQSYIVCLDCGSRKHFDVKNFKACGEFYFPPEISNEKEVHS